MGKRVFISYSHEDAKIVQDLTGLLDHIGVDYFLDVKDINWGAHIPAKVRGALADSSALIVVFSPASLKSQWVPYEIGYANALGVMILPFLTHPSLDIPLYTKELNFVSDLDDVKRYFTEFGVPSSPMEMDLLEGDGKFEWQWAGQNWHGFVVFTRSKLGGIEAEIEVHKISKTQEVASKQTIRKEPVVMKSVRGKSGTAFISDGELALEDLVVRKSEFEVVEAGQDLMIEGFKPLSISTEILGAKLKRVPAFAGRIAYKNKRTGNEGEGDMILVKYKSTIDI